MTPPSRRNAVAAFALGYLAVSSTVTTSAVAAIAPSDDDDHHRRLYNRVMKGLQGGSAPMPTPADSNSSSASSGGFHHMINGIDHSNVTVALILSASNNLTVFSPEYLLMVDTTTRNVTKGNASAVTMPTNSSDSTSTVTISTTTATTTTTTTAVPSTVSSIGIPLINASYVGTVNTTGWDTFSVVPTWGTSSAMPNTSTAIISEFVDITQLVPNSVAPTAAQIGAWTYYAAGYAEGYLTQMTTYFNWLQNGPSTTGIRPEHVILFNQYIQQHFDYLLSSKFDPTNSMNTPWQRQVGLWMKQLKGIADGYHAKWVEMGRPEGQGLTYLDVFMMNLGPEMEDILSVTEPPTGSPTPAPSPTTMAPNGSTSLSLFHGLSIASPATATETSSSLNNKEQISNRRYQPRRRDLAAIAAGEVRSLPSDSHCSALIRIPDDASDLYFAHTTWSGYNIMFRQFKTYDLPPASAIDAAVNQGVFGFVRVPPSWYQGSHHHGMMAAATGGAETTAVPASGGGGGGDGGGGGGMFPSPASGGSSSSTSTLPMMLTVNGIASVSVVFSGYPSTISSGDDWYVTSKYLAITETTIDPMNQTMYNLYTVPTTVSEFIRVMVANILTDNGRDWVGNFSVENSGTYCNEWMVVDMKKFIPNDNHGDHREYGSTNSGKVGASGGVMVDLSDRVLPGTLWVADQVPGNVTSADLSDVLIAQGYFASYNIPYFASVQQSCQYTTMEQQVGAIYSHQRCPRGLLFTKLSPLVQTKDDMKNIMRYNHYMNDTESAIPNCTGASFLQGYPNVCDPTNSPQFSISCRADLSPIYTNDTEYEKHYGIHWRWSTPQAFGGIDSKVMYQSMMRKGILGGHVISGPTTGGLNGSLPYFSWSRTQDGYFGPAPLGQVDTFNFSWVTLTTGFTIPALPLYPSPKDTTMLLSEQFIIVVGCVVGFSIITVSLILLIRSRTMGGSNSMAEEGNLLTNEDTPPGKV